MRKLFQPASKFHSLSSDAYVWAIVLTFGDLYNSNFSDSLERAYVFPRVNFPIVDSLLSLKTSRPLHRIAQESFLIAQTVIRRPASQPE